MSRNLLNFVFVKLAKRLKFGTFKRSGTNFSGKICVFHRGGGNKKFYKLVDFYRRLNSFGVIYSMLYDPNRSAYLGLVLYDNGFFSYIVLSEGSVIGQQVFSGTITTVPEKTSSTVFFSKSTSLALRAIGLFSVVSNVEARPAFGASIARAAGVGAVIVAATSNFITLKLKSG